MRLVQTSKVCRLAAAIGLGLALVVLLLLKVSQAGAQPPVPHDVVFLIDNSWSVTDSDRQDVRLSLTHFLVNVLGLDLARSNWRVGVIGFGDSQKELMPLWPVQDWSKADFAEIHKEVDQGYGTNYKSALDYARRVLLAPGDCSTGIRRCDVVMVTDGSFKNTGAPSENKAVSDTERALRDLQEYRVSVHVLTFEALDQERWQGFLATSLVSTYQPNITLAPRAQVYGAALRALGAEALLADLAPVEVAGEYAVTITVLPFRTWTRYQILPDSPMTVTFLHAGQAMEPVVTGREYTFFQPPAGEWLIRLQGNGLAYYRQVGEGVADLALYLRMPEGTLALGDDVPVQAGIVACGAPVTDTQYFTVTATITGPGPAISPLVLARNLSTGLFTATVPSARFTTGTYTITLAAESILLDIHVRTGAGVLFELVASPSPTAAQSTQPSDTPIFCDQALLRKLDARILPLLLIPVLLAGWWWVLKRRRKRDRYTSCLDNEDFLTDLSTRSIEANWLRIEQGGEQLALVWRTEHWKLYLDNEKQRSALQETLTAHSKFEQRLQDGNQSSVAVLVYAGLLVSCEPGPVIESKEHRSPVPTWTVLEGSMLTEPGQGTGGPGYTVGNYLSSSESRRTFSAVWDRFRTKKGESWRNTDWETYNQLIQHLLHKHLKDGVESLARIERSIENEDDPLRVLLDNIQNDLPVNLGRHPVLKALVSGEEDTEKEAPKEDGT